MVKTAAAKKRIRLNEDRRLANKAKTSAMKTSIKQVLQAVEDKDLDAARKALPHAVKKIDKVAKANILHANTAARRKSIVCKAVAGLEK